MLFILRTKVGWGRLLRNERGQSFILMLLVILPLLILVFGLAYDLGNVAAGVSIAQNAADLAAQEAAKMVDVTHYVTYQDVRLRPEAALVAQQVADEMTGGAFVVDGVYVDGEFIRVEGRVAVRTPFLETFLGRRNVTRPVAGIAEAAYGIEQEGGGD
jgi:uncharacterized membrane protein